MVKLNCHWNLRCLVPEPSKWTVTMAPSVQETLWERGSLPTFQAFTVRIN